MRIWVLILIVVLGVGCANPLQKWLKAKEKVENVQGKIDKNKSETLDKAKGTVWATDYALSKDPDPNIFSLTAKDLNLRTASIVGDPNLELKKEYQKIVDGLVSTNEQLRTEAKKLLDKKDNEIINLQDKLQILESKLSESEKEKSKISEVNSLLANKWAALVKWVKIVLWGIVIGVLFAVISQVLAAIAPAPYNQIFSILGLFLGMICRFVIKLFPSTKKFARVVDTEVHETSEKTIHALVGALQDIRKTEIKPGEIIHVRKIEEMIDPILLDYTDENTRKKILDAKVSLGHI